MQAVVSLVRQCWEIIANTITFSTVWKSGWDQENWFEIMCEWRQLCAPIKNMPVKLHLLYRRAFLIETWTLSLRRSVPEGSRNRTLNLPRREWQREASATTRRCKRRRQSLWASKIKQSMQPPSLDWQNERKSSERRRRSGRVQGAWWSSGPTRRSETDSISVPEERGRSHPDRALAAWH